MTPIGQYGPSVIGKEQYEKEQATIKTGGGGTSQFGPAVTSTEQLTDTEEERIRARREAAEVVEVTEFKRGEGLPSGYKAEKAGGGYYVVTDPAGELVPGPFGSNPSKFKGEAAAQLGAWEHRVAPKEPPESRELTEEERAIEVAIFEATGTDAFISIASLVDLVRTNPATTARLYEAEKARPDGPRYDALMAMLAAASGLGDEAMEVSIGSTLAMLGFGK